MAAFISHKASAGAASLIKRSDTETTSVASLFGPLATPASTGKSLTQVSAAYAASKV